MTDFEKLQQNFTEIGVDFRIEDPLNGKQEYGSKAIVLEADIFKTNTKVSGCNGFVTYFFFDNLGKFTVAKLWE